jgi:GGDEF domain-containing protein
MADGDHHQLARVELRELAVTHVEVGALLASRWNLPNELMMPIKYHERPTAAPLEYVRIVHAVALGAVVADLLAAGEPGPVLKRLHTRGEQWLALRPCQCEDIVEKTASATRQVAALLEVDPGKIPPCKELLARAAEQLRTITLPLDHVQSVGATLGKVDSDTDPVTGLPGRMAINRMVVAAFEQARSGEAPLSLALLAPDEASLHSARDESLRALAAGLRSHFQSAGAVLCRFDETRLGVVLPGADRVRAAALLETARALLSGGSGHRLGVSAGLATLDRSTRLRITDAGTLVSLTEQALAAAQRAGQGVMRMFTPRKAA